jgi:hypothetical protein
VLVAAVAVAVVLGTDRAQRLGESLWNPWMWVAVALGVLLLLLVLWGFRSPVLAILGEAERKDVIYGPFPVADAHRLRVKNERLGTVALQVTGAINVTIDRPDEPNEIAVAQTFWKHESQDHQPTSGHMDIEGGRSYWLDVVLVNHPTGDSPDQKVVVRESADGAAFHVDLQSGEPVAVRVVVRGLNVRRAVEQKWHLLQDSTGTWTLRR